MEYNICRTELVNHEISHEMWTGKPNEFTQYKIAKEVKSYLGKFEENYINSRKYKKN